MNVIIRTIVSGIALLSFQPAWAQSVSYGTLTAEALRQLRNPTVIYDLNYFRLNPTALADKAAMQYFIALNNCNDRAIERAMLNELDYPQLAAYYQANAQRILSALPKSVSDITYYKNMGGYKSNGWILWAKSLTLGEYDPQRKSFPFKFDNKNIVEIPNGLSLESDRGNLGTACPVAARVRAPLPATYRISVKPATYTELPMNEADARAFIESAGSQPRTVFLAVDVRFVDSQPDISRNGNNINQVNFSAEIARIRVINQKNQQPIGTLFDDNSVPLSVPVTAAAPALPKANPAAGLAAGDHLYEIRSVVYIAIAAKACGWPLTPEQSANVQSFLDRTAAGRFNDRYQYNAASAQIRNAVSANGRENFCGNPAERQKFDKLSVQVSPLGSFAAPSR